MQFVQFTRSAARQVGFVWPDDVQVSAVFVTEEWKQLWDAFRENGTARMLAEAVLAAVPGQTAGCRFRGAAPFRCAGHGAACVEDQRYGIRARFRPELVEGDELRVSVEARIARTGATRSVQTPQSNRRGTQTVRFNSSSAMEFGELLMLGGKRRFQGEVAVDRKSDASQKPWDEFEHVLITVEPLLVRP